MLKLYKCTVGDPILYTIFPVEVEHYFLKWFLELTLTSFSVQVIMIWLSGYSAVW